MPDAKVTSDSGQPPSSAASLSPLCSSFSKQKPRQRKCSSTAGIYHHRRPSLQRQPPFLNTHRLAPATILFHLHISQSRTTEVMETRGKNWMDPVWFSSRAQVYNNDLLVLSNTVRQSALSWAWKLVVESRIQSKRSLGTRSMLQFHPGNTGWHSVSLGDHLEASMFSTTLL